VLPKITKYLEQAFDEAIELARSGDERARLHLRRIVLRDPESAQGKVAAQVLRPAADSMV
jgi:cobalamin biosynthesis protein CobD/CbiB